MLNYAQYVANHTFGEVSSELDNDITSTRIKSLVKKRAILLLYKTWRNDKDPNEERHFEQISLLF